MLLPQDVWKSSDLTIGSKSIQAIITSQNTNIQESQSLIQQCRQLYLQKYCTKLHFAGEPCLTLFLCFSFKVGQNNVSMLLIYMPYICVWETKCWHFTPQRKERAKVRESVCICAGRIRAYREADIHPGTMNHRSGCRKRPIISSHGSSGGVNCVICAGSNWQPLLVEAELRWRQSCRDPNTPHPQEVLRCNVLVFKATILPTLTKTWN